MRKQELINLIEKLPENIDVFNCTSEVDDQYKVIDIKIFLKPKDAEFYQQYFSI